MTTVVLSETGPGRYAVRLGDEVIVEATRDPEHDAARALLARGITGPMVTTRANGVPCMRFASIEGMAGFSMEEGPSGPKRVRLHRPQRRGAASPACSLQLQAAE